jgi:hypothetical protein
MEIKFLTADDRPSVRELFLDDRYMGKNNINEFYLKPYEQHDQNTQYYHNFVNAYLSDLTGYHALGAWVDNKLVALISSYQSIDEPSWFYTQIKSNKDCKLHYVHQMTDRMIEFQESTGRLKFYSLWHQRYMRSMRRFALSTHSQQRYDYFDEYYVPARHRCLYTHHWQILFNRVLLPVDTVVRCSFLRQKYRSKLILGAGL